MCGVHIICMHLNSGVKINRNFHKGFHRKMEWKENPKYDRRCNNGAENNQLSFSDFAWTEPDFYFVHSFNYHIVAVIDESESVVD